MKSFENLKIKIAFIFFLLLIKDELNKDNNRITI